MTRRSRMSELREMSCARWCDNHASNSGRHVDKLEQSTQRRWARSGFERRLFLRELRGAETSSKEGAKSENWLGVCGGLEKTTIVAVAS